MIKRTIEISTRGLFLAVDQEQLVIKGDGRELQRVPIEDIGVLLLATTAATYTHAVITRLLSAGAVIVACDDRHLPCGLLLPQNNSLHTERLAAQVAVKKPVLKQLWRQLIVAKIAHQAEMLGQFAPNTERRACSVPVRASGETPHGVTTSAPSGDPRAALLGMKNRVRSGDPENLEAQAARRYWTALLGADFRRDPDGPPPNNLLNYGYMALRAAVARAVAAAGLHPSLGIHHHNRSNVFCLADDLMEPLRPLVDRRVKRLLWTASANGGALDGSGASQSGVDAAALHNGNAGRDGLSLELTKEFRRELLGVLTETVQLGEATGPLMVALDRLVASLVRCYGGEGDRLEIPRPWTSADTDS